MCFGYSKVKAEGGRETQAEQPPSPSAFLRLLAGSPLSSARGPPDIWGASPRHRGLLYPVPLRGTSDGGDDSLPPCGM